MQVIQRKKQKMYSLDAEEIELDSLKNITSPLAKKVLKSIIDTEKYPKQISKELKENEQKIYYHIRNMEKSGIIKVTRQETVHGTTAKFYKVTRPALVLRFKELIPSQEISSTDETVSNFLKPFIVDGKFDARIVIGSPDPHGLQKARSRDGYYGIDLALFFGTFLNYVPEINVRLDTETTEKDLKENLIIIGGPITNSITNRFNSVLPINFTEEKTIYSKISKTSYSSDETGLIVKTANPLNSNKSILIVAGKRFSGTRAAITAFLKNFKEICRGNKFKESIIAKVVEGLDLDSDGVVDAVEFRE
jgi:predicted transcriptional regulator